MAIADPSTPRTPPSGRQLIIQLLVVVVVMAALVVAIIGLLPGSGRRLSHVTAGWIVVAVLLELTAIASYWWTFDLFFSRAPYRIGKLLSVQIAIGELGAFVIAPFGAGGPVVRFWALLKTGMPWTVVITRAVSHDLMFNLPYLVAALLLGTSAALGIGPGHASLDLSLSPLGVAAIVIAAGLWLLWLGRRHQRWLERRPADAPAPDIARWKWFTVQALAAIPAGLRELLVRIREPQAVFSSFGFWIGDCAVLVVGIHAAGGSAPIAAVALAYMLGQLGNLLPLPGGVGGFEPIVAAVLGASGVNLGLAGAAIIIYRLISLGLQSAGGALCIATLPASLRARAQTAQAQASSYS
jgi:putative heme transporter